MTTETTKTTETTETGTLRGTKWAIDDVTREMGFVGHTKTVTSYVITVGERRASAPTRDEALAAVSAMVLSHERGV